MSILTHATPRSTRFIHSFPSAAILRMTVIVPATAFLAICIKKKKKSFMVSTRLRITCRSKGLEWLHTDFRAQPLSPPSIQEN